MADFSLTDYIAIAWFALCWIGYTQLADHSPLHKRSMSAAINEYRRRWTREMLKRENRIVDTQTVGNQLHGTAFFASTAILAIGGLFAFLGATDEAVAFLQSLPVSIPTSRLAWEVKVLLLIVIFVYTFFKFAWAYRLYNLCSVVLAAAPEDDRDSPAALETAERLARLNQIAAGHFNRGMRAYFFTLAALAWFAHPLLFIAGTAWVVSVLYRREFRSKSLAAVRDPL